METEISCMTSLTPFLFSLCICEGQDSLLVQPIRFSHCTLAYVRPIYDFSEIPMRPKMIVLVVKACSTHHTSPSTSFTFTIPSSAAQIPVVVGMKWRSPPSWCRPPAARVIEERVGSYVGLENEKSPPLQCLFCTDK